MSKEVSSENSRALNLIRINIIILSLFAMFYGFLQLADHLTAILILFCGAFILTYLFLGPVEGVEAVINKLLKKPESNLTRIFSVFLVYLVFFMLLGLFAYGFLPALFSQVRSFANDLPGYLKKANEQLGTLYQSEWQNEKTIMQKLTDWTDKNGSPEQPVAKTASATEKKRIDPEESAPQTIIVVVDDVKTAQKEIEKTVEKSKASLKGTAIGEATLVVKRYTATVMDYLVGFGKNTATTLVFILTGMVMVFYMLIDGRILKEGFVQLLPSAFRAQATDYLSHIHDRLYYFIQGQVILGVIAGVGMWLVCVWFDVRYAFLLSVVFGVASIIPVIGPWFGIIPVVLVSVFAGGALGVWPAWVAVLMYAGLYYLLKIYWLVPRWFQNRLEIHPVIIILTFLACMKTANLMGIIMAYPLASVIAGTQRYLTERRQSAQAS